MTMTHLWEELTSAQLADRLAVDPDCVALIPVGATEQHGPHLPVGTDTIIATALADTAAGEVAVVLPPLPFGAQDAYRTGFAGEIDFAVTSDRGGKVVAKTRYSFLLQHAAGIGFELGDNPSFFHHPKNSVRQHWCGDVRYTPIVLPDLSTGTEFPSSRGF